MSRKVVSRRTVTLLDQALSSLTNFIAGIYAAHRLSPDDFGLFAIFTMAYVLLLGATRAAMSDVATVTRLETESGPRVNLGASDAVLLSSLAVALCSMGIGVWLGAPTVPLAAACVGIICMVAQDTVRVLAIARDSPGVALASDAAWLAAVSVGAVIATGYLRDFTAYQAVELWGFSAAPALLIGVWANRWRPQLKRGLLFMRDRGGLAGAFFGDWALKQGTSQVATYGLGLMGGLAALAGIRAALLVLGPLNIAFTGLQMAAMPAAVRLRTSDPALMRRRLRQLSLALGILPLLVGLAISAVPTGLIELLVGGQAAGLRRYVIPLAVSLAATGFTTGSTVGLRVLHLGRSLVVTRALATGAFLGAGLVGALITSSAVGGLWGLAIGALAGVALWERAFRRLTLGVQSGALPDAER